MPERAPLAVLAACAVAVVAVAATALADGRDVAFTLGVRPAGQVAVLARGDEVCQRPIDVPASADRVRFAAAVRGRRAAPLRVRVRTAGRRPATASVVAPRGERSPVEASLDVREGQRVAICVENRGRDTIGLYGGPGQAAGGSGLYAAGRDLATDLSLEFERANSRSALSLAPAMLERASLFNVSWVAPWLLWALAAAFATAVPLLLAGALRSALRDPGPPAQGGDGPP